MELKIFRMKIGAIIALFMIAVGVLVAAPLDRFKGANYDGYAMHSISNTNIPIYRIAGTVIAIY